MLWHGGRGKLTQSNTGGSTGEPLIFHMDRRRQACDQAARIRTHKWFDVNWGDRELYIWGSPIEFKKLDRVKKFRDRLFNHKLINAFDMSSKKMDSYLDELEQYSPHCIFGYPSSVALLCEHAEKRNRTLHSPDLRAVFVTGEVCHQHHRDTIERVLQVPVANGYGSREAGFLAHECPHGKLHITAENVVIEILHDMCVVPTGEQGEIVVTHLDAYGMPFIRYKTGDVGSISSKRCSCGRGLPVLESVSGRTTDFIYLPDGTVKHALSVIYPLRELAGVKKFRVHQNEDYSTKVSVEKYSDGNVTCKEITSSLRKVIGNDITLDVEFVPQLPALGSGKHRYVISNVNKQM